MEKFDDIFESINLMHKKYRSKDYIDHLDDFTNNTKDLEQVLEKYNVDKTECKPKKKRIFKKK